LSCRQKRKLRGAARGPAEQSEREECDPALFESAGAQTAALADREEAFFRRLREAAAA